jgi:hypothetical protein
MNTHISTGSPLPPMTPPHHQMAHPDADEAQAETDRDGDEDVNPRLVFPRPAP